MAIIEITPEQQERLTNDIINKIFNRVSLPQSAIDKIIAGVDLGPVIDAVQRNIPRPLDGKDGHGGKPGKDAEITDELISNISIKAIEQLQEIFKPPKDGKDGRPGLIGQKGESGRDGLTGPQGAVGFRGPQGTQGLKGINGEKGIQGPIGLPGPIGPIGEPGQPGQDAIITDDTIQKAVDLLDLSTHVTKSGLDKIIKQLIKDIALGRIELPTQELGGGLSGPRLINEISKVLGQSDWVNGLPGDGSLPANLTQVQFTTGLSAPSHSEGLLFYDENNKTLGFYNDESDSTLQIGQEVWKRGLNLTGSTITNGQLIYINGNSGGIDTFGLANASAASTAIATIAFATHNIENGTIGIATKTGTIRDVDTSSHSPGAPLWLDIISGAWVGTVNRPISPNYNVFVGNVGISDNLVGTIDASINAGGNTGEVIKIFNGAILEDHTINASSNGTIATLTLERNGGGDLSLFFDGLFSVFDTTPAASVTLTAGSDIAPTLNFVYIPDSTKTLTVNTTGFPTNEQVVPIAEVLVQSAASMQTDGGYKVHAWTDHLSNAIGQGHLSHVNNWIRHQPATWLSGVDPTTSITVNGGAIDNVYYSSISGNILQLHEHTFPVRDMETGDPIFMINDPNTAYRRTTDLSTADETSLGVTLRSNNTYYSIVVWGVISESEADSKIYGNLPSGFYANSVDAITDPLGFTNTTIPTEYTGTGFLIARIVLRYQTVASGTITEILTESLRGVGLAGGGGATGGTEFSDNLFRILNVTDDSKEIDFSAERIDPGNIRTIIAADRNTDLINVSPLDVTILNAATYTLLADDTLVHVTYTTTGAVTSLTIPSAQISTPREFTIKDGGGNAATNNITIDTEGAETIDGATTFVISLDYESVTLYSYNGNLYSR